MNVIYHHPAGPGLTRRLAALDNEGLSISVCEPADRNRFRGLLSGAEVIWHLLEPLTAEIIASAPRLRLIQKIGVGVNTIDVEAARRRGVAVCNMPGTNTQAVAEMTLLLMLGALRRATRLDAAARTTWRLPPVFQDHAGRGARAHRRAGGIRGGAAPPRPRAARAGRPGPVRQPEPEAGRGGRARAARRPAAGERRRVAPRAPRARHRAAHRRRRDRPHEAGRRPRQHRARRAGRRSGARRGAADGPPRRPRGWTSSRPSRRRPATPSSASTTSSAAPTPRG